jgi:hypothetical protein
MMGMAVSAEAPRLDREEIVRRHDPVLEKADRLTPMGIGLPGGDFVFTADATGLQTLAAFHEKGQQLNTMAGWAWHAFPNPHGYSLADTTAPHPHGDGTRPYSPATPPEGITLEKAARWPAAAAWLRANPHRFSLGRLGFVLTGENARRLAPEDLSRIRQRLDLWSGALETSFMLEGCEVRVTTVPTGGPDGIAARIESALLEDGRLALELVFPGASDAWGGTSTGERPEAHRSELLEDAPGRCSWQRTLDETRYRACMAWSGTAVISRTGPHGWRLTPNGGRELELSLSFAPGGDMKVGAADFAKARLAAAAAWSNFWKSGGMVDFAGSTDPRAAELERRVVLSLHLTAIHCAGPLPPQETGLAQNSWFGKFHLEMLPWHAAQFALWGRPEMLDRLLDYYRRILPAARATAANQGCMGARWPKMTDPSGRESPSDVGVFLAWQQPHPVYLAELVRRAVPGRATLERHRDIVYETADFLASFPRRMPDGKLHLIPPLIPAQECYRAAETSDPAFELAYFRWALGVARQWRVALGDPPEPAWDTAWRNLAPLPHVGDRYATVKGPPFTNHHDHPCVAMVCGWLPPADDLDMKRFGRTFDDITEKWDWPTTWGWDPPVLALAAARLGRPEDAVAELLRHTPKNTYLANGHNYQDERLPLYLPGNGGLLHAVAAMAAGWEGAPERPHPGFPADGRWRIRAEGVLAVP